MKYEYLELSIIAESKYMSSILVQANEEEG